MQWLRGLVSKNRDNNRMAVVLALSFLLLLAFCLCSVLGFLFSGGADQSLLDPSLTPQQLQELGLEVRNPFGLLGARMGNYLFNELFGFGTFALFAFGFQTALYVVFDRHSRLIRALARFLFWGFLALWSAIALTGLQQLWPSDTFLVFGGAWGAHYYQQLALHLGTSGLLLLLLGTVIIVSILCSDRVLKAVQHPPIKAPELRLRRPSLWERWTRKPGEADPEAADGMHAEQVAGPELAADELYEEELPYTPMMEQPAATSMQAEAAYDSYSRYSTPEAAFSAEPLADLDPSGGMIVEQAPADDLVDEELPERAPLAPGIQLAHYQKPSIDLLRDYEQSATGIDMDEIEHNKQKIIDTLASFKMPVTPCKATVGPTVTLYEVIPDSGIKVSRIKAMDDDIAMGLKSEGVRIIAPMPGQGTIGIEVPNSNPQTVSMRSILASRKYREQQERMELPVGIGKTITNEPFIFDLVKMPHLLIAGATGQGKSVGLNALITSLLYSKRPEELKFVMVDPKMLEFSIYEEIEHQFLAKLPDSDKAIITDMSRVVATLNSLCVEMDNRYRKLQTAGRAVRNIKEYNEQVRSGELSRLDGHELMPYIVLIVDEFADLMMTVGKEVEQPIARLAQKARAAGIHMVIATQRPSTDVITGLIKANFPARIAFKVFSMVDSRTVLDSPGANQLIGRGDMLFYQGKDMIRVQCAFMDTPETELIVEHIASQESLGYAYELPEYVPEGGDGAKDKGFSPQEKDSLFDEVALLVVQMQVGSTSYIQRKFNIGYNRAGRLMDQLEGAGVVGPQEGSKPREVYIKDQASLQQLLDRM